MLLMAVGINSVAIKYFGADLAEYEKALAQRNGNCNYIRMSMRVCDSALCVLMCSHECVYVSIFVCICFRIHKYV